MKKNRYNTVIRIKDGIVEWSECECAAIKGCCKHAIALLYAVIDHIMSGRDTIPATLACTSQPRQWGKVSACPFDASQSQTSLHLNPDQCVMTLIDLRALFASLPCESQLDYSSLPAGTRKDIV